jgi:apolipoprotein N-acyltransferase
VVRPLHASLRWALAAAAGLINGAAFVYVGPLALIANVPLLFALRDPAPPLTSALLGGLVGFLGGVHIYGVLDYGWLLFWGFAAYTASQMVVYALLFRALWGRAGPWFDVALPALIWALTEWMRTVGPLSMPASYVGCIADVQWLRPWLALAPITGGLGVSTLVALAQSALFHALAAPRTHRAPILAALGLIAAVGAWGALDPPSLGDREVTVAGVQGGLPNHRYDTALADPAAQRENVRLYETLTKQAYATGADLVLWPETAVRAPVMAVPDLQRRLFPPADARGTLIAGLPIEDERGLEFNAALAVAPGGRVVDTYRKVRLVPNSEASYTPGDAWRPLQTPVGRVGVLICLESVFPEAGRATTRAGAEVLAVLSNDAGFRRSPIARHMTNRAIVQALENGRWLVRVGQAGISAIVDPRGTLHATLGLFEHGLLTGTVRLRDDLTPYTRFGDWWMGVVALGLAAAALTARRAAARSRSR